jgi:hypothetical protein
MRRFGVIVAAMLGVAAAPAPALANHGTTCTYTSGQAVVVPVPGTGVVVYEGSGMSGQAAAAVGVCLYSPTSVGPDTIYGGTVEAGAGAPAGGPGAYAIVDGDNNNVDTTGTSDGYVGVSNFETSPPKGSCNAGSGTGTNSGGCFEIPPVAPPLPIPLIACGNTSGNTWDAGTRDGCRLSDFYPF